ncbi:MAG: hypothetical protein IEMM0008_1432 [bacterium]|nr:MAG: hypothetical protein IEMM0008_1432 [bacterium]
MVVEQTFLSVLLFLAVSDCQTGMSDLPLQKNDFLPQNKLALHELNGLDNFSFFYHIIS